jgi:hypothetical protein
MSRFVPYGGIKLVLIPAPSFIVDARIQSHWQTPGNFHSCTPDTDLPGGGNIPRHATCRVNIECRISRCWVIDRMSLYTASTVLMQ